MDELIAEARGSSKGGDLSFDQFYDLIEMIDAEGEDDDDGSDDDDVGTDDEIDDGEIDAEAEREMAEEVYKEIKGKVMWIVDVIL